MNAKTIKIDGLNKRLKVLRVHSGFTQDIIAEYLGIDRSTYAYYELGRTEPQLFTIKALAKLYHISTDFLLGVDDDSLDSFILETRILKYFGENV